MSFRPGRRDHTGSTTSPLPGEPRIASEAGLPGGAISGAEIRGWRLEHPAICIPRAFKGEARRQFITSIITILTFDLIVLETTMSIKTSCGALRPA